MAIFQEIQRNKRLDDPEIRRAEELKRKQGKGKGQNFKKKSSGVSIGFYQGSVRALYWLVGLAGLGGLGYGIYRAVLLFIGA